MLEAAAGSKLKICASAGVSEVPPKKKGTGRKQMRNLKRLMGVKSAVRSHYKCLFSSVRASPKAPKRIRRWDFNAVRLQVFFFVFF